MIFIACFFIVRSVFVLIFPIRND